MTIKLRASLVILLSMVPSITNRSCDFSSLRTRSTTPHILVTTQNISTGITPFLKSFTPVFSLSCTASLQPLANLQTLLQDPHASSQSLYFLYSLAQIRPRRMADLFLCLLPLPRGTDQRWLEGYPLRELSSH